MKCPYAVNRQVTTQTVLEYNDEGQQKKLDRISNQHSAVRKLP